MPASRALWSSSLFRYAPRSSISISIPALHFSAAFSHPSVCSTPSSQQRRALSCRQHSLTVQIRKDTIRQRIKELELLRSRHPIRREFSISTTRRHGHIEPPKPGEELHVTFIDKDGDEHSFEVAEGDNLLDIAQANDLEMEGACGGSCACSTCHVIVKDDDMYDKIEEPSDDENDMLDLAFGLTETSRLGCQVKMNKDLDGLVVQLPAMTRNMQASDFEKKEAK